MKDEMDILREVGSIAAGNGSTTLSEILRKKITLRMPSLDIIPSGELLSRITTDQIVISVSSHLMCGLKGDILFMLDEKSAFKLIDMCYRIGKEENKTGDSTEMGMSLIKEVGNVVISSYAGSLSIFFKIVIIPSIPTLVSGPIQQIMSMVISPAAADEYMLLVEAIFEESGQSLSGSFYLVLSSEAIQYIQDSCKRILGALS